MANGIYAVTSGSVAVSRELDVIANNLANVSTTAFKRRALAFSEALTAAQRGTVASTRSVTASAGTRHLAGGALRQTGNPLDLALKGPGYLVVQRGNERLYTRVGSLARSPSGALLAADGSRVLDPQNQPIQLPPGRPSIDNEGRVFVAGNEVARVQLAEFDNPESLKAAGAGLFRAASPKQVPRVAARTVVHSGHLETSNVKAMREMTSMLRASRSYELFQNMIASIGRSDRALAQSIGE